MSNGAGPAPVARNTFPSLTVPQLLAFAAFVVVCVLAALAEGTVKDEEFEQVKKLAIFLIGALLPSDALIRFGRNLFLRRASADPAEETANPAQFQATTLAQLLAFAAFVVVVFLTLVSNSIVDEAEFKDLNEVAVFLIAALLPSEAGIRFGRALYLRDQPNVTPAHLKQI